MLVTLDDQDRVIAVNDRFLERTGHQEAAVLGRVFWDELLGVSSRVLYHTQLAPVLQLDGLLQEVMMDVRLAEGGGLPALMNAIRRADRGDGTAVTQLALMSVRDRRAYEDRLRQAHIESERALLAEARSRRRLELLAQANTALASSLDIEVALQRLTRVLAAELSDWCLIFVPDPDEPPTVHWSAAHTDPAKQSALERLADLLPEHNQPEHALLIRPLSPVLIQDISQEQRDNSTDSDEVRALYDTLGLATAITVPAYARGNRVAVIVLGRSAEREPFDGDNLADVTDLAARTGIVIDNLRRQAREHSNSIALQNALLTTPPTGPGFTIVTRYLPATNGNEVGGDWYDAALRPDGTLVLTIGDVLGHDIHAAAAMGQLRGIIRTLAYTTAGSPAAILGDADSTARGLGVDVLATAVIARIMTDPAGPISLQWSNAGHPAPLLITASGVEILARRPDRLLGLGPGLRTERHDHSRELRPGDTLLFYTDGLVERSDEDIDRSIEGLAEVVRESAGRSLDEVCELAINARGGDVRDDIAMLAVRVLSERTQHLGPSET